LLRSDRLLREPRRALHRGRQRVPRLAPVQRRVRAPGAGHAGRLPAGPDGRPRLPFVHGLAHRPRRARARPQHERLNRAACAGPRGCGDAREATMEAAGPQPEPATAWRRLGHRQRMDVLHHARQGRPYPDREVAAIALRWAQWWQAQPFLYQAWTGLRDSIKLYALLAVALLGAVQTGGQLTVGRSWSLIGSVACCLLVTAAIVAARVWYVRADASKVERTNLGAELTEPAE